MQEQILLSIQRTQIQECEVHYLLKPVDAGYAGALGSALRRVLLSSLPGAAITSIQITEARHEFQDIPEVVEDVTDIVHAIKHVRLRCFADHAVIMHLDVQGECEVTAADILAPSTVEIVNPELHIATLDNERAHLEMELVVANGRGFVSAELQAASLPEKPPLGRILTDALYSPVVRAHFFVEPLYQGRMEQTACIHLEITTDGSITPDEALRQSAEILQRQCGVFANALYKEEDATWKRPTSSNMPIPAHIYETSIEDLKLPVRAYNCLKRAGITTIGFILERDKTELLEIRNVGEKVIEDLTDCLDRQGFLPGKQLQKKEIS